MSLRRQPRRYDNAAPEVGLVAGADLAFPKSKFVPRGRRPDLSGLALPKDSPDRDRSYLDYVRSEICAVWADDAAHCAGVTEASHLEVLGKGIKASDYLTVPLCTAHHRQQHAIGIVQFQIIHCTNLWEVSARLLVAWVRRISR